MTKILLVDDEAPLRITIAKFLEKIGHVVTQAANGQEGVIAYENDDFDLVLMDIVMPVMGGLEAIGRIRSVHPDALIVALSAGWTEHALNPLTIALDLGATRTIDKPYELAELRTVVDDVLSGVSGVSG